MFSFPLQWFPSPSAARLFSIVLLIWFAAELTNMVIGRRGLMRSGRKDRGSFWVIIIAVYVCFTIPFIARGADLWVITGGSQYAGIALVLVGIALREWSILVLGRYFSVVVRIESDHHLITAGPYRWLRHPSYTGTLITIAGFGLALGSVIGVVLAVVLCLAAYSYRAQVEERALLAAFGEEYSAYVGRTWRFFPGW
jgi:protein-S-isoprenylcysteine O-methyltransferase Ste14